MARKVGEARPFKAPGTPGTRARQRTRPTPTFANRARRHDASRPSPRPSMLRLPSRRRLPAPRLRLFRRAASSCPRPSRAGTRLAPRVSGPVRAEPRAIRRPLRPCCSLRHRVARRELGVLQDLVQLCTSLRPSAARAAQGHSHLLHASARVRLFSHRRVHLYPIRHARRTPSCCCPQPRVSSIPPRSLYSRPLPPLS